MADPHTVFAQRLIPGTQRDSLNVLDGLIANQTGVEPEMVSADTAGASEIVFARAWALGYRGDPGWPIRLISGFGASTATRHDALKAWPGTASTLT